MLRGRTPIRRCGNVKRDDDVSGCEASLYDRVASRVHPLAGCRGAAAETERSEGKGRFGGILNTVTSRRIGVRGCTEQERKRKRRDKMLTRDVIIACDFASAEATFAFLDKFEQEPRKPFLKIGKIGRAHV